MPNNSQPKTLLWKLTEDQVSFLNLLLSHCPCPLDEYDQETFERTRYELNQLKLELESDSEA